MKIKSLNIKNFKSIVDLELIEPNPFTVFVGPNGAGKSNIFEALEFFCMTTKSGYINKLQNYILIDIFGGREKICNRAYPENDILITLEFNRKYNVEQFIQNSISYISVTNGVNTVPTSSFFESNEVETFIEKGNRVFVKNKDLQKINFQDSGRLSLSCDNLEKVLKQVLQDDNKREEIKEWLALLIPGFANIDIISSEMSNTDTLVMYEESTKKPFTKDLISDGTYNILALLTAVYQSDEPQFLCIEEPENGLNPYVVRKLVDFFRAACQERGHYIWLNTHSHDLVACLEPAEVVIVDKIGGETKVKQIKDMNLHGLDMAEVWLSGALGGGTPW